MLWQATLPERYRKMSDAELAVAVAARKAQLGHDLVILGHHYQQDEVIQFADFTGDSFKLSQLAAERVKAVGAKHVVFCGVHFMAESADILAPEGTTVILPDMSAGCSMADMADYDQTVQAWEEIHECLEGQSVRVEPLNVRVVPICYMNSSAAIKAFCGERGGAVCTSSNCQRVLEWAYAGGAEPLAPGQRVVVLFIPDQHLGRNTAAAMGYDPEREMCVWDPKSPQGRGGLDEAAIRRAAIILWKGHCSVHKLFRPEHVDQAHAMWPDAKVIVHPECAREVVAKADMTGSTEGIIKTVMASPAGSRWFVGTEVHMVNRLAQQAAAKGIVVRMLSECQCLCTTMYRIDLPHLLWTLDNLAAGKVVNQVSVHPDAKHWAGIALQRMLDLVGGGMLPTAVAPAAAAG